MLKTSRPGLYFVGDTSGVFLAGQRVGRGLLMVVRSQGGELREVEDVAGDGCPACACVGVFRHFDFWGTACSTFRMVSGSETKSESSRGSSHKSNSKSNF